MSAPVAGTSTLAHRAGLQTEYFQLVQAAVYHADGMWGDASFDLYLKELPADCGYVIAAGIDTALDGLLATRFEAEDVDWLRQQPVFSRISPTFFDSLSHFRFQGEVVAVDDGTPVFPGQPILRVTAPLPWVGLLGTRLLQTVGHQSGVATRAARLVDAAAGRPVIDFGSRRSANVDAAWQAARAAWIGGCAGTTDALAAATLGVPAFGIASDSLLAAYDRHDLAFGALRVHFPDGLHVELPDEDIYDGVDRFGRARDSIRTVRLDHRDLAMASRVLRDSLNRRGMQATRILGSSSLDPQTIERLVSVAAPVDLFGVGAGLSGEGALRLSYRMCELVRGLDPTPATGHWSAHWPGRKQVMRFPERDVVCLEVETPNFQAQGGRPLLKTRVEDGALVAPHAPLLQLREGCLAQRQLLPADVRRPQAPTAWTQGPSDLLAELALS